LEAIARISQRLTGAAILVFTMHQNAAFAVQAFRAGARGYITKSSPPQLLIRAVYDVAQGRQALSPDIAQSLALSKLGNDSLGLSELTVREFDILRMLCEARSTEDIARVLHISPKTVANCHYQIKQKLGVGSDIELVHLALRMRIVDLLEIPATGS
jgi:DNA-binding NarL/FixJ family response regulator